MTSQRRRLFAGLFVAPRSLALMSLPFILLASISIGTVFAMQWRMMKALENVELFGQENLAPMNALHEAQKSVTLIGAVGIVLFALACFVLWIVFSHRIFGPTVPIRRHVQALAKGDYSSRIYLREGDQLQDIVEDLNRLAKVLAEKETKSTGSSLAGN